MTLVRSSFINSFYAGARPFRINSVTQLPNLEVNYDASVSLSTTFNSGVITSGTSVSAWHNAGGLSSHDWNSTGGTRPVWTSPVQNGLGTVQFNGTSQYLSINPIAYLQSLSAVTMVLVFRTTTTSGTRYCTTSDTGGFQWGQNGTQWIGQFASSTFSVDSVTVDTNFHHVIINFDGSKTGNTNRLKVRLDGADSTLTYGGTVGTATSAAAKTFYGGVGPTGSANFWQGDIAELMIWTRSLSTSEVLAVEDYITNKWAV